MPKAFHKPDLNAPRFRPKKLNFLNKAFYDAFRGKFPQWEKVGDKDLKSIIEVFNKLVWETVIENRDGVELLEQLGFLFIGSCPRKKGDNADIVKSFHYGFKVQHQNWESDQFVAKIFYTNYETKYRFKFHRLWGFTGHRDFRRTVGKTYPQEWKKYLQVDNFTQISRLFRKTLVKDFLKKREELTLENYDEFDMT